MPKIIVPPPKGSFLKFESTVSQLAQKRLKDKSSLPKINNYRETTSDKNNISDEIKQNERISFDEIHANRLSELTPDSTEVTGRTGDAIKEKSSDSISGSKIKELLEKINLSLTSVNEKIKSIFSMLMNDGTPDKKDSTIISSKDGKDNGKSEQDSSMGVGLFSKISGAIGQILFAIYPVALAYIESKRKEISDFLYPVFKFLFEGVVPFFTKTIPDFFTKDMPNYFSEKFNIVSDFTADFIGDFQKVIASIGKTIGEVIVNIANTLPDNDFLKSTKESLKKIGTDMISSAVETTKNVDAEQAERKSTKDEKKKMELVLELANMEGKRVVEANKAKGYTDFTVIPSADGTMMSIEYTIEGPNAGFPIKTYDLKKSLTSGVLEEKKSGTGDTSKEITPITKIVDANKSTRSSDTSSSTSMPASPVSGSSLGSSSDVNTTINAGSGNVLPGSSPESVNMPSGMVEVTSDKGKGTNLVTASIIEPPLPVTTTPPIIPGTSSQSIPKTNMLPGSGPHDISDVPDPSPYLLGDMANQLFFGKV